MTDKEFCTELVRRLNTLLREATPDVQADIAQTHFPEVWTRIVKHRGVLVPNVP